MCLFIPPFFCFFGSLLCCLTGCLIAEQVESSAMSPQQSDVVLVSVDKTHKEGARSSPSRLIRNPDADLVIVNQAQRPQGADLELASDVVVISCSKKVPTTEAT